KQQTIGMVGPEYQGLRHRVVALKQKDCSTGAPVGQWAGGRKQGLFILGHRRATEVAGYIYKVRLRGLLMVTQSVKADFVNVARSFNCRALPTELLRRE